MKKTVLFLLSLGVLGAQATIIECRVEDNELVPSPEYVQVLHGRAYLYFSQSEDGQNYLPQSELFQINDRGGFFGDYSLDLQSSLLEGPGLEASLHCTQF